MNNPFTICNDYGCGIPRVHYPVGRCAFSIQGIQVTAHDKYDKMGFVGVEFSDEKCDVIQTNLKNHLDLGYSAVMPSVRDGLEPVIHSFDADECIADGCFAHIQKGSVKSLFAVAALDKAHSDTIVAYGCTDVDPSVDQEMVSIEMEALPVDITGEYTVISNFDLTSAFEASENLPYVEKMSGGDWIKFVGDLFAEPVDTLYDFLWQNSIARLELIPRLSDLKIAGLNVGDLIKNLLMNDLTKEMGLAYLKPLLEDSLKGSDGKLSWYDILLMISPDVEDLVRNMQFGGQLIVEDVQNGTITAGSEKFTELQYQWSYSSVNCTKKLANAYAKAGKTRCAMSLNGSKYSAIEGNWTGTVTENGHISDGNAELTIDSHSLSFKWASILYAVIFNTILPSALSYPANDDNPLSAFMTRLLFEPIVARYQSEYNNCEIDPVTGEYRCDRQCQSKTVIKERNGKIIEKTFPCLQIKTVADYTGQPDNYKCGQFIESIIYMIAAGERIENWQNVITVVAKYTCDEGLSALDDLVWEQLERINSGTKNELKLSTENCALYDEGAVNYQKMGILDEFVWTANEVFGSSARKSSRCIWQVDYGDEKTLLGLFHAVRQM